MYSALTWRSDMKTCARCGKTIHSLNFPDWAYKIKLENGVYQYYCSWGCFNRAKYGGKKNDNK